MLSFLQPLLYIQITPERVRIINLRTGTAVGEVAELAVGQRGGKQHLLAAGTSARLAAAGETDARLIKPFAHPRTLVSDFLSAEMLLRSLAKLSLGKRGLLAVSPAVVIHPMGAPEGDFTAVELRAFRELALGIGASNVQVWTGRPLTEEELRSRRFPPEGGHLRDT